MFMYKTREIKYIYTKLKTLSNLVINAFLKTGERLWFDFLFLVSSFCFLNSSLFQFDLRFETKTKLDSPRFS